MNADEPDEMMKAEERAALWAAKIDGDSLDAGDRGALDTWLAEAPSHAPLLSRYRRLSRDLAEHMPLLAVAESARPAARGELRRTGARRFGIAFAAMAAAAAVAIVMRLERPDFRPRSMATPAGQRRTLTLADGTRIELNARTRLDLEDVPGERRVRLAEGEAYFVVTKDRAHPFVVETAAGSVRVTGTTFDVRSDAASELDVTVVEGSVQVSPRGPGGSAPAPTETLRPGNRLSVRPAGASLSMLSPDAVDDLLAWRDGKAVFAGTPLREALDEYARYYGRTVTASPGAAELAIGGRFSLDDFDGFLAALPEVLPVRVVRLADGSVRVEPRGGP